MKITKAIEILETWNNQTEGRLVSDFKDALKLGIEALKQRQKDLEGNPLLDGELLPGETEE